MKNSVDTHMGSIVVDNNVIANYAGNVALECYGVVGMAAVNMRDDKRQIGREQDQVCGVDMCHGGRHQRGTNHGQYS